MDFLCVVYKFCCKNCGEREREREERERERERREERKEKKRKEKKKRRKEENEYVKCKILTKSMISRRESFPKKKTYPESDPRGTDTSSSNITNIPFGFFSIKSNTS